MLELWGTHENPAQGEEEKLRKRSKQKTKRGKATIEKSDVRIGKKGPTDYLVQEISRRLDKRKVVKVKVLKAALIDKEAQEIAQKIANETESEIAQIRGHTFTLRKPRKI